MIVGGDIMLNGVGAKTKIFPDTESIFRAADVFYANLEVPLTKATSRTVRKSAEDIKRRDQFVLKANPVFGSQLAKAGLDVVSLANNHAMDYGPAGLSEMLGILKRVKIAHNGAGANEEAANRMAVVRLRNGRRVGFLSYLAFVNGSALAKCSPATKTEPGIAVIRKIDLANFKSIILKARKTVDTVVICPHWGIERQPLPRAYQVDLGRAWIDAGADIVVGAHPHVLQPAELYRNKPILYSLGNFVHPGSGLTAVIQLNFNGNQVIVASALPVRYRFGSITKAPSILPKAFSRQTYAAFLKRFPSKFSKPLDLQLPVRKKVTFPKAKPPIRL